MIDRKKQIEAVAEEKYEGHDPWSQLGFIAGAQWADQNPHPESIDIQATINETAKYQKALTVAKEALKSIAMGIWIDDYEGMTGEIMGDFEKPCKEALDKIKELMGEK